MGAFQSRRSVWALAATLLLTPLAVAQPPPPAVGPLPPPGTSIFHEPWLNWDFLNFTGGPADNFEIIVGTPNFTPNQVLIGAPFPTFTTTTADFVPSYPGKETKLSWSGAVVPADGLGHVGGQMNGSGPILDAYWTLGGAKVGNSVAISYELTEIVPGNSPDEIHMLLQIAPGFFEDQPSEQAGWQNIRTWKDLPADLLDLEDLNANLDLDDPLLQPFETTPTTNGQPIGGLEFLFAQSDFAGTENFFDVMVGETTKRGAAFESLLFAEVVNQGQVIGQFWNLNPQSPEPSTLLIWSLLAGLGISTGWRRKRS